MNTEEIKEARNKQNEELRQEFMVLNDNRPVPEEISKYDILKRLRIKLGKSKVEFQKILELYKNVLGQKNTLEP
jgi:hypothetical protein